MSGTDRPDPHRRLMRWFPRRWRERYKDEFSALLDSSLDGSRPTWRMRWDVARAGLAMRLREAGLVGDAPPTVTIRSGASLVLAAWAIFVVAGIALQRGSEHWQSVTPSSALPAASTAFGAIQAAAVVGTGFVVIGALAVLPAFLRFVKTGELRSVAKPAFVAGATSAVAGALLLITLVIAWTVSPTSATAFRPLVVVLGIAIAAGIAAVTFAAIVTVHRLELSERILRIEGWLAVGVAAAIVLMTVAASVWAAIIATSVPWTLHQQFDKTLLRIPELVLGVVIGGLMAVAAVSATLGATRVARGLRAVA